LISLPCQIDLRPFKKNSSAAVCGKPLQRRRNCSRKKPALKIPLSFLPLWRKRLRILKSFLNFQKKRKERYFWRMPVKPLKCLNQRLRI